MRTHRRAAFVVTIQPRRLGHVGLVGAGLFALAACGGKEATPRPGPAAPAAPALATAVDGQYQLPAASAGKPLPVAPLAHLFVSADGTIRVGKAAALAQAVAVADVDALRAALPPDVAAPAPVVPRPARADVPTPEPGAPDTRDAGPRGTEPRDTEPGDTGGTGTAMQPEEGRMGSGRPSGQYRMRSADDLAAARDEALREARAAGVIGSAALTEGGAFASITGTGDGSAGFEDVDRYGGILGEEPREDEAGGLGTTTDGRDSTGWGQLRSPRDPRLIGLATLGRGDPATARVTLVGDRAASVAALRAALSAIAAPVAVAADDGAGSAAALPFVLEPGRPGDRPPGPVLVVRVDGGRVQLSRGGLPELVEPTAAGGVDRAALTRAIAATDVPGDPLVAVEVQATSAARFADLWFALEVAATTAAPVTVWLYDPSAPAAYGVGMGGRGSPVPRMELGQPGVAGELDRNLVRRYIKRNRAKLGYCYEKALLVTPDLAGTVTARFVIGPGGTVTSVEASGVTPEVSTCVAEVLRAIEFPKPRGGGRVEVTYPFDFRPAGG